MNLDTLKAYRRQRREEPYMPASHALRAVKGKWAARQLPIEVASSRGDAEWEELDSFVDVRAWVEPDDDAEPIDPWGDKEADDFYRYARGQGASKAVARERVEAAREAREQFEAKMRQDGFWFVCVEARAKLTGYVASDGLGWVEGDYIKGAIIDHGLIDNARREALAHYLG